MWLCFPRPFTPNVLVSGPGKAPVSTLSRIPHPSRQTQAGRSSGLPLPVPELSPHGATALQQGKNEDASHLQDLVAEGSVSNHFLAAPALKASPGNPPLQSQMVLLSPTEHVGTQDAPHPTKHRASLTLAILVALGCKYTNTREDALHGVFNPGGARWHSHVSHISFTLSPESRVISNSTGRRRDGGSSMEREKPAGVRRCRDEGSAAGGTQRALVPGLRALGTRTHMARAGPGPAPVPCPRPAPGHPRTLQGPATHWQNSERKRRKKKAGKWPQPPLPSQRYSQQHTLSTGISPCTSTSLGR